MIGKTHRAGGTVFAVVGFEVMRQKGLLLPEVNPLIQLAVMYPVAQWASTLPDLDHHWGAVGGKSPVNWVVHKLLHLTRPKHRSWQTHSILVSGGLLFLLYSLVLLGNQVWDGVSSTDWVIMRILITGFILGYVSHLFLDSINPSGIHLIPGYKIRFVPRTSFFATGGTWETKIIYPLCLIVSVVFALSILLSILDIDMFGVIQQFISNKG